MNKKGFTLVELLAVIVILAIIALITIPIVIKTINNSEEEAEKQSIVGYARAIEDDIANYMMLNPGSKYENYTQTEGFDYKGNKVFCESKEVSSMGKLTLRNCYVSDKELSGEEKNKKNIYNYEKGKIIKQNDNNTTNTDNNNNNNETNGSSSSGSYKVYYVGDEITVAGEQYYVIAPSDSSKDYVTALKANPLTVDEINTYGVGHVNRYSYDFVGTPYDWGDANHTGGIQYYSSPTCGYAIPGDLGSRDSSGCSREGAANYNNSEIKYVVDTWSESKFTNGELKIIDGYGARLITLDELMDNLGYSWDVTSGNAGRDPTVNPDVPNWVNGNYYYWTMNQYEDSSTDVWQDSHGMISPDILYDEIGGVRPVINVYKSKIN